MKVPTFLLIFAFAISVHFDVVSGKRVRNRKNQQLSDSKKYNNPIFAEFDNPSTQAVSDLNQLRDLKVLDFYVALDELYLTGGFDKSGTINNIILSQTSIPDDTFQLLIRTLRLTRRELKNGDSSLTELNSLLESNESEQTKNLLIAVKKSIRNSTETTDNLDSFIQKISKIELNTENDLSDLNEKSGDEAGVVAELLEKLKKEINSDDFKKISEATQNAFYSGIGGIEDVKNALIAGSRLIYNLGGSVDTAKTKCTQVIKAFDKDPSFGKRLNSAMEIVKRLNQSDSSSGEFGYQLLFNSFFDGNSPKGNMIFLPSKLMKLPTMLNLFKELQKADDKIILQIMTSMSKDKFRVKEFQWFLDSIQNDKKMVSLMNKRFGVEIKDQESAKIYRSILEKITEISVDSAYLLRYVRSVISVAETGNYKEFMESLISFSQLSRDNQWRDIWNSMKEATSIITSSSSNQDLIAPFKGLNETISGSYEEVFLALKMLLADEQKSKIEAKCKFIDEFFTGLSDRDNVLKALGVEVSEMHKWIDSAKSVDALVEVLKAAENYGNLNRLLEYHGKYTTVDKKPLESMDLIDNFINYLEQSGRWNKKQSENNA